MGETVRISHTSDMIINDLVSLTGKSKIAVLDEALESYYFHLSMKVIQDQYKNLKSNSKQWKEELTERNELEGTLMDGLENDEDFKGFE